MNIIKENAMKHLLKTSVMAIMLIIVVAGCGGGGSGDTVGDPFLGSGFMMTPEEMADRADAILSLSARDHQKRSEALILYRGVILSTGVLTESDLKLRARAELGMGIINVFDLFDILPTLLNLLGMNITDLIGGLGAPMTAPTSGVMTRGLTAAPPTGVSAISSISSAIAVPPGCAGVVNFGAYLPVLNQVLSGMLIASIEHFKLALEYDPDVRLIIQNGVLVIAQDKGSTPQSEYMALDLSGEWDGGDIGVISGALEALMGALKILSSYQGVLQSAINPAFNPSCNPAPGSPEWVAVFGEYGVLDPNGGNERMIEARDALSSAFGTMAFSFNYLTHESDNQSNDLIGYLDWGTDAIPPTDPLWPGPDANGSEGNGQYDPGEIWGMASAGTLLSGLLGGTLPLPLGDLSRIINPPMLSSLMDSMSSSAATGSPVDLTALLFKPLFLAIGLGGDDASLYALGLPGLNFGALFNPPWASFGVISPLADLSGTPYVQVEASDETHTWPDGSGRIDDLNGITDPAYMFYPDLDISGNSVGVFGGLILNTVVTPEDFDVNGMLIGTVDFTPMMNSEFNKLLTFVNLLLGLLGP